MGIVIGSILCLLVFAFPILVFIMGAVSVLMFIHSVYFGEWGVAIVSIGLIIWFFYYGFLKEINHWLFDESYHIFRG